MPELRRLRAFVTVAEELNFTRAAERLHLGQQGVSKSVRQLERELGVDLLERTTREVRLTPAGAVLLDDAREALLRVDAALARARDVGRGLAGTVRVGLTPAIGPAERDEAVRALRDGAPELRVSLHELRPGEVAQALRDHSVDLVLARTAPPGPEVESTALRPFPTVLFVPSGHPLAGAGPVRLAQLDGERLLTWNPPGTPFTDLLVTRLTAAGARVEPVQARVTGGSALAELSEARAIALMPAGWPDAEDVARVDLEDDITLPLLVLWGSGRPPVAVRRLLERMSTA